MRILSRKQIMQCNSLTSISAISWRGQVTCCNDDADTCFVLHQTLEPNMYSATTMKQQPDLY